jgi:ATP-binding cassette subfamily A (ABC1) protein 3
VVVDDFGQILSGIFPFFIILVYLGPIYQTIYAIVQEKELRSKESMRMMGMSDFSYWLSWFVFYSIQVSIVALISWGCLMINVINDGSAGYIFLYIWLFGLSCFGQIILYQALFSRAKYSGLVGILIFFLLSYVQLPLASSTSSGAKLMASIIPQCASAFMSQIWASYSSSQIGLDSHNVRVSLKGFSFMEGIAMLFVGLIVFALIGFYFDAVLPKQYGQKSHPCFCFMPASYRGCCGSSGDREVDEDERERRSTLLKKDHDQSQDMECKGLDDVKNYEPVATEVARQGMDGSYLRIEDLKKTYDNGFQAVKGLNLKIYQNQIFALLGQNGAGKSTTIGMLTGLFSASEGSASVYNYDMFRETDKVRNLMGICPQHDVLFNNLTPREHLDIFYDFKGGNEDLK